MFNTLINGPRFTGNIILAMMGPYAYVALTFSPYPKSLHAESFVMMGSIGIFCWGLLEWLRRLDNPLPTHFLSRQGPVIIGFFTVLVVCGLLIAQTPLAPE